MPETTGYAGVNNKGIAEKALKRGMGSVNLGAA
jgi:hypothetical protein